MDRLEKTMADMILDSAYQHISNVIEDLFNIAFSTFENDVDKEELRKHLIVDIKELNLIDDHIARFDMRRCNR